MDIFLSEPGGEQFQFPVNPEEIQIRTEKQFETVNIIQLGEIDFPNQEKVKEITFSSFFPKEYDSSYCRYPNIPDPEVAMKKLTDWTTGRTVLRLLIGRPINVAVLLSAHTSTFKGGEPGDIYFDLTCRTYRSVTVQQLTSAVAGSQQSNRADEKPLPKIYTVKPGDNLWKIAQLQYGNASKLDAIYETNKALIGKDKNLIQPGMKLVMPL